MVSDATLKPKTNVSSHVLQSFPSGIGGLAAGEGQFRGRRSRRLRELARQSLWLAMSESPRSTSKPAY
jgi:hypothetical protein